jgi:peptidoglycan hydrolase-like protein with peptidoglycan-binding domain
VLGAATFNFARDLGLGLSGADVTELQKILIAAGILKINAPTGNFGQLTKTAVQAFQKSHGVSQTGFVGSLTRGELNKGTNLTTAQADAILSFLESFGAGASAVANAKTSFGR